MNKLPLLIGILSTMLISATAIAGNSIEDKHLFEIGVFSQNADITMTSTVAPQPPTEIDLIDELGMDDSSTAINAMYRWRFAEKWSLSFRYQQLELDGKGFAAKSFNFNGRVFTVGAFVETEFDMQTYLVDVGYSLVRNDKWDVVIGAGLHAFDFDTTISGLAFVNDGSGNIIEQFSRASADVLAPLPNLRLGAIYMINPRWEVNASVGWLSLEIDQIDGEYTYLDIGTEYRFTDKFGIGASYQLANIDVTSTKGNSVDKIDLEFTGPSIFFTYGF
jgi:long-subunit fatty acid transport protein